MCRYAGRLPEGEKCRGPHRKPREGVQRREHTAGSSSSGRDVLIKRVAAMRTAHRRLAAVRRQLCAAESSEPGNIPEAFTAESIEANSRPEDLMFSDFHTSLTPRGGQVGEPFASFQRLGFVTKVDKELAEREPETNGLRYEEGNWFYTVGEGARYWAAEVWRILQAFVELCATLADCCAGA